MQTGGKLMKAKFKVLERAKAKLLTCNVCGGNPATLKQTKS